MPKVQRPIVQVPLAVFSTFDESLEDQIASLPNSMSAVVRESIDRLAKSTGATLNVSKDPQERRAAVVAIP